MSKLPRDIVGFVLESKFVCRNCITDDDAIDDEDKTIPVLDTDDWLEEVGPCTRCGDEVTQ